MASYQVTEIDEFIGNILDSADPYNVIKSIREGVDYEVFSRFDDLTDFTLSEWSGFLHVSERTLQRYKTTGQHLGAVQSEKFLAIALLFQQGIKVFGSTDKFSLWLYTIHVAFGGVKPKELLDNSFGIEMIKSELGRIEHGILA
ncbi:MAG: DUF2384 domain-containing protein [Bacteroidia bacterium]|nr:DUF2384 domain-containing protein [Bacteroidia bacterium]